MYKALSMDALGYSISFNETCALARKHNFTGVLLDSTFLDSSDDATELKNRFDDTGLAAAGFWLRAAWRETDSDAAFAESLRRVTSDAALAQSLGCKRCLTRVTPSSHTRDFYQHFDLVVPRLIQAADILGAHGIMLGFEYVALPMQWVNAAKAFVHTFDGVRTLAASIGMRSLNTGVMLDSFQWHASGGSLSEIEDLDHHEVVCVQLNDAIAEHSSDDPNNDERVMLGATGVIDVPGFLRALRNIGYLGPLTVGPVVGMRGSMGPERAAAVASAALDQALG